MNIHVLVVVTDDHQVSAMSAGVDSAEMYTRMEDTVNQCILDARPDLAEQLDGLKTITNDGWTVDDWERNFKVDVSTDGAVIKDGDEVTTFALRPIAIDGIFGPRTRDSRPKECKLISIGGGWQFI